MRNQEEILLIRSNARALVVGTFTSVCLWIGFVNEILETDKQKIVAILVMILQNLWSEIKNVTTDFVKDQITIPEKLSPLIC